MLQPTRISSQSLNNSRLNKSSSVEVVNEPKLEKLDMFLDLTQEDYENIVNMRRRNLSSKLPAEKCDPYLLNR